MGKGVYTMTLFLVALIVCLLTTNHTLAAENTVVTASASSTTSSSLPQEEKKKSWLQSLAGKLFNFISISSSNKNAESKITMDGTSELSASTVGATVTASAVQEELDAAVALLTNGNVEAAIDKLVPILQTYPDHPQANGYLGAILMDVGQYDRAEPMLILAATASNWSDITATRNLSRLLRLQQNYDLAMKTLLQTYNATTITREDTSGKVVVDPLLRLQLSVEIAETMYISGNYSQAADFYLSTAMRYAMLSRQSTPPLQVNLTNLWIQASTLYYPETHRDLKRAENVFIQGVQLHPADADLLYNLGLVLYATGRSEQALVFYEEALRQTQNQHAESLAAYATALHSMRRFPQAQRVYALAIQAMPTHVVLLANYARMLYLFPEHLNEAAAMLQRAYDLEPTHPDVLAAMQEMGARVVPPTPNSPEISNRQGA